MYTRFYDDTVVTRFIKGFLANTNIPLTSVVSKGDRLACGNVYISKDGNIIRAAESLNQLEFFTNEYSIIDNYIYNKEYKSLTSTYISNISGYDSITHRWLGEFLRFYRDYFGIDMMPFYNCFGNDYIDNVNFNSSSIFTESSENTKLLIVPIKYNTTYYVAIDSTAPIEIQQGFYGPKGLMNELNSVLTGTDTYKRVYGSKFSRPFSVDTINIERLMSNTGYNYNLYGVERYFRLFIKIPYNCKSSIAVIEGDLSTINFESNTNSLSYTGMSQTINTQFVTGVSSKYSIISSGKENSSTVTVAQKELSPLGLLQLNDGNTYAFSNRLIEYLLLSIINPEDSITDNIARVQQYVSSSINANKNYTAAYKASYYPGIWESSLKTYLFNLMQNLQNPNGISFIDINGYVDKDTEKVITRGQGQ